MGSESVEDTGDVLEVLRPLQDAGDVLEVLGYLLLVLPCLSVVSAV